MKIAEESLSDLKQEDPNLKEYHQDLKDDHQDLKDDHHEIVEVLKDVSKKLDRLVAIMEDTRPKSTDSSM